MKYPPIFICVLLLAGTCFGASKLQKRIAADEKNLADAQAVLERASNDLSVAVTRKRTDFENSAELKTAVQNATDAQNAAHAARDKVIDELKKNPTYKAILDRETTAQASVDSLKAKGASSAEIRAASDEALRIGSESGKMERDALEQDEAWKDANAKQLAAAKTVSDLRDRFNASIVNDPNLSALRKAKEDAELKVSEASAKLAADQSLEKHK